MKKYNNEDITAYKEGFVEGFTSGVELIDAGNRWNEIVIIPMEERDDPYWWHGNFAGLVESKKAYFDSLKQDKKMKTDIAFKNGELQSIVFKNIRGRNR